MNETIEDDKFNKEDTICQINIIKFYLNDIRPDIVDLGRDSDHVYQAKYERYVHKIDEIIDGLTEDGLIAEP